MGDFFSSSGERSPQIPDELKPLISGSAAQILATQNALPLSAFAINTPQLTADLSNLQKYALNRTPELGMTEPGYLASMATAATIPELTSRPVPTPGAELGELQGINYLTGGPLGTSPATREGMRSWYNWTRPVVQNELALAGLGRSGYTGEAIAKSATEASVPLIQQEIENRLAVLPMLSDVAQRQTGRYLYPQEQTVAALRQEVDSIRQLGDSMFNQQLRGILTQLQAGEIPRDVAEEQFTNAYNDFLRLQALSEASTLGVFGALAPSAIGFKTTATPSGASILNQVLNWGGTIASMIGAAGSDEREKRDIKLVDSARPRGYGGDDDEEDDDTLERLDAMPIHTWRYKKGNAYGSDHRKPHIGPMSRNFHNAFDTESPTTGRESYSVGDAIGVLLAATKSLNRKVNQLEMEREEGQDGGRFVWQRSRD